MLNKLKVGDEITSMGWVYKRISKKGIDTVPESELYYMESGGLIHKTTKAEAKISACVILVRNRQVFQNERPDRI